MKLGQCKHEGTSLYGIVEGHDVLKLEGSPFAEYGLSDNRHALSALTLRLPCVRHPFR
ncbi:MAG: hypothetical protein JWN13_4968 [Betaproteobacteria bacterium]|jgi:hypothetical protein|nr:hypothetical protein [Betaproteobacteria bacterium]MEA3153717.1 hypothetical protein [Betaproteobacteria bacterium]